MAEESTTDTNGKIPTGISESSDTLTKTTLCQTYVESLRELEALPRSTKQEKQELWTKFIPVWHQILKSPPTDAQLCYELSAQILEKLLKFNNVCVLRNDGKLSKETCFACISLLNHPNIRRFLQLPLQQQELNENHFHKKNISYLLHIISQTISVLSFSTKEEQQCMKEHLEVYRILIRSIDESIPNDSETTIATQNDIGEINVKTLSLLWNTTDQTVLIPILLRYDLAKLSLSWLARSTKLVDKQRRPLISIIHNISRHDDGADELNKYDAVEIIKNYKLKLVKNNEAESLVASMTLALLSTPEQLKHDKRGMNTVLDQLLHVVFSAAKGVRHRYNGFHVSEPLVVLVKMFVVEERTIDYVFCHAETRPPTDAHTRIGIFSSLLQKFSGALNEDDRMNQYTLIALLNIFWSISFLKNYTRELTEDQQLIAIVQQLIEKDQTNAIIEQYKPRSMEGVKEAAHGILYNLNLHNRTETNVHPSNIDANFSTADLAEKKRNKPSVMISYCHQDDDFCTQVLAMLNKHKDVFDVWIDRTHCQGVEDLWEAIAHGMEQATVIISLLSTPYLESKSCRKEFVYATDSLKKRIIPVLIGQFQPQGWLGIRMTGMMYIRFRKSFENEIKKVDELSKTIITAISSDKVDNTGAEQILHERDHSQLKATSTYTASSVSLRVSHDSVSKHPKDVTTEPLERTIRPIEQWTSENGNINEWFIRNHISMQICDLYDFQSGEEMLEYAKLLSKDREKHANIYECLFSEKYNGKNMPPHEFNRFALAMDKLLRENPANLQTNTKTLRSEKSRLCNIL